MSPVRLDVIGGGLAGSEAAWQAAQRGVSVTLHEMRPGTTTPAHLTDRLAELVCSNSLGSDLPDRAGGLLKAELRRLGSLIMAVADQTSVPAGGALAVDREVFADLVTSHLEAHPNISIVRSEVVAVPDRPTIVASGPLTSERLSEHLAALTGADYLYFYDALAPLVAADSIDLDVVFRASRYGRGEEVEGDYLNCPLNRDEFETFVVELVGAERIRLREFEREDPRFFEACLPIEVLAARSPKALRFGPMRPVGLRDPRTGSRPHAVVQLRQDNAASSLYNLVGFQTNLTWPEQRRVLRLIPGLAGARFERLGQMHRNTYLNAPRLLEASHRFRGRSHLWFAGQLTGIEGYAGNAASGLVAGINAARTLAGLPEVVPPPATMIGSLCRYISEAEVDGFQPMKANFGLLPPLGGPAPSKQLRHGLLATRALEALEGFVREAGLEVPVAVPESVAAR